MRGGSSWLRIETGRWRKEKRKDRICQVCIGEIVEDEKHYLLECPMYVRERAKMFEMIRNNCNLQHCEEMDATWQLDFLIGHGLASKNKNNNNEIERKTKEIVVEYMKKANKIRSRYVS